MKPIKLFASSLLAAVLLVLGRAGPAPAADTICTVDVCPPVQAVHTPLGQVAITADLTNVTTVRFAVGQPTLILASPEYPIIPGNPIRVFSATVDTTGGAVTITTVQLHGLGTPLQLAIVSIHPPNPCRPTVTGTTAVFTPIIPSGPPLQPRGLCVGSTPLQTPVRGGGDCPDFA
jgi:hypothetical protein